MSQFEPGDFAHRAIQLRVFFSVDLVGGTAYKSREPAEDLSSARSWPTRFEAFFQEFISSFKERVTRARSGTAAEIIDPPQLWKINGDELLFTELVFEADEQRHAALKSSLRSFVGLVHETDEQYIPEGLGVRACVWTAGFPLRNRRVQIIQGGIDLLAGDVGRSDPETGPAAAIPVTVNDYIGRDMDIGFRLAAGSPPGRIVCSLDLAHFVQELPIKSGLSVWHVGWSPLKGVIDGKPYPIFWLEDERPPAARHPWDDWEAHSSPEVQKFLIGGGEPLNREAFADLESKVHDLSAGHLIVPYPSLKGMPADHRRRYDAASGPDPTREIHAEADTALTPADFAVSPSQAETIRLDDLNQLRFFLQDFPDKAADVRGFLAETARHRTYAAWNETHQFEGTLFRLDPSLAFAATEERYLLEALHLVQNDALRVKINLCGDQVFVTDGLWIDPSIRAFPFSDESDLVIRACEESGWADWATCVIDPATGCGHNLLRYGGQGARRYGLDRNARGLAYAGINAALNGVEGATFGNGDIRQGIPPFFAQGTKEHVLVLANMPFALVPNRDAIARSADGGRHGYELTVALLDAFEELADQLDSGSELRCVILTYTIGSKRTDSWVVPNYAFERFGREATTWRLWEDEKLWRVNGRKQQDNPMPLTLLKSKADCRFYVRGNVVQETLRGEYEQLTEELAGEGHEDLAYGVITVRHPRRNGTGH